MDQLNTINSQQLASHMSSLPDVLGIPLSEFASLLNPEAEYLPAFTIQEDTHGRPYLGTFTLVNREEDVNGYVWGVYSEGFWLDGGSDGDCEFFQTREEAIATGMKWAAKSNAFFVS